MLLVADALRCRALLEPQVPSVARAAFERLMQAYLDGLHVVAMSPELCRVIESSADFSVDARAAACKARNKYAEHGGLRDVLSTFAVIVDAGTEPTRVGEHWEIPLQWIAQHPLQESQLLSEDLYDVELLVGAAEDHQYRSKLFALRIRLDRLQGGGGNAWRVLENSISASRHVLCIVDSDRECPGGPIGPTAANVLRVTGRSLYETRVTDGRELENVIPWKLLDERFPTARPAPSEFLAKLAAAHAEAPKFADLKRGCFGHDVTRLRGSQCGQFWFEIGESVRDQRRVCCATECAAANVGDCRDRLTVGLGNLALRTVAQWLKGTSLQPTRHASYLPSPGDTEWRTLGKKVFEFGLGMPPRRI